MIFFFMITATTDIYTYLHTFSLHDALPIWSITTGLASGSRIPLDAPNCASVSYSPLAKLSASSHPVQRSQTNAEDQHEALHLKLKRNMLSIEAHADRKSTRLNSSH